MSKMDIDTIKNLYYNKIMKHPDFILSHNYKLNGIWKLCDINGECSYNGILDISPNGIRLKLFILAREIKPLSLKWETICGELLTGEKITLINCFYTGGSKDTTDILCHYVIAGKEHISFEDLNFDKIYMEYDEHRAWLLPDCENVDYDSKDKVVIEKDKSKELFKYKINKNINITMKYCLDYTVNCFKEAEFREHYYFIIEKKNYFSLKEAIENYCFNWKILLSLFVGYPCNILTTFLEKDKKLYKLYFCTFFYKKSCDLITPWMFMPYYAIKDNMKKILYYWFKKISKQKNYTRELFFTGFEKYQRPDQESFLALMKAIEGLANEISQSNTLTENQINDLNNIVKNYLIEQGFNSKKRKPILNKLKTINEKKSLADKVQKFINITLPHEFSKELGLTDYRIHQICDIRNTLSHNKGIHYFYVCNDFQTFVRINFILVAILLYYYASEMGIAQNEILDGIYNRYIILKQGLKLGK